MFEFNTVEEAVEDLKAGKIILVTDDEDRENEGDFICAAEFATTENVNFMATYGKGLICMPMSEEISKKLYFPHMVADNTDNHETAFTVSIDHVDTTTGISAKERAYTTRMVERFETPYLYLTFVFVLLGLLRYIQIAVVDKKSGDPTKIILRDHFSQVIVVAWILTFLVMIYVI